MNLIYEVYHSNRTNQKRVIADDDFTYQSSLRFLQKYGIKDQKILDIGCGVGTIDFYIVKNGGHVMGIDVSKNGINVAKHNAINLRIKKNLRFKVIEFPQTILKGEFDKILCSEVLEHIKNDKLAVTAISKLLKKNGIVIASSPSINAPLYKMSFLKKFDQKVGHLRRYSKDDFIHLFQNVGLEILEIKGTEGILRNFLFTNSFGGLLLRILNKKPLSRVISFIDDLTIPLFGESNIYLVARKK